MSLGGVAPPDPFMLYDTQGGPGIASGTIGYRTTAGRAFRSPTINPSDSTLILMGTGQSLLSDVVPTLITPTNASVIDNANIYDGALYDVAGALLGTTYAVTQAPTLGPGNVLVAIADTLIDDAKFDRVIIAPVSIGGTSAAQWEPSGIWGNRATVMMARLASRGITPATPGTTWACYHSIGETDFGLGTSQAAFAASTTSYINNLVAAGFNGRFFVPTESNPGETSNAIRSAQASLWNGTNIFSGGNFDSNTIARSSGAHPSDAGAVTMAAISIAAMAASGAPF